MTRLIIVFDGVCNLCNHWVVPPPAATSFFLVEERDLP
jgi:hypothetical protein